MSIITVPDNLICVWAFFMVMFGWSVKWYGYYEMGWAGDDDDEENDDDDDDDENDDVVCGPFLMVLQDSARPDGWVESKLTPNLTSYYSAAWKNQLGIKPALSKMKFLKQW